MRLKLSTAVVVLATAVCAAVAVADGPTITVTTKARPNPAGSKKAPASITPSFTYAYKDPQGLRPPPSTSFAWRWDGVIVGGSGFPTCSPQQIDAKQSASVCPKGSLVAVAKVVALAGPENNRASSVHCDGKSVNFYNNGSSLTALIVGPAEKCAGVAYLPPTKTTLKTSGGSTLVTFSLPPNISHPLPGVVGAFISMDLSMKQLTRTVKGKKKYFISAQGCKHGSRALTLVATDDQAKHVAKAKVGACT